MAKKQTNSSLGYVASSDDDIDDLELKFITDEMDTEYHSSEDDEQASVDETAAKPLADDGEEQVDNEKEKQNIYYGKDIEDKVLEEPGLTPVENSVPAEGEQGAASDNEKRSKMIGKKDLHKRVKQNVKDLTLESATTVNDKIIQTTLRIPEKYNYLLGICSSLCRKSKNDFILDSICDSLKSVLSKNGLEHLLEE